MTNDGAIPRWCVAYAREAKRRNSHCAPESTLLLNWKRITFTKKNRPPEVVWMLRCGSASSNGWRSKDRTERARERKKCSSFFASLARWKMCIRRNSREEMRKKSLTREDDDDELEMRWNESENLRLMISYQLHISQCTMCTQEYLSLHPRCSRCDVCAVLSRDQRAQHEEICSENFTWNTRWGNMNINFYSKPGQRDFQLKLS